MEEMVLDIAKVLTDGFILSALSTLLILVSIRISPRLWLQDYPKDIQALVPPKTAQEQRQGLIFGIPFLLLLIGFPLFSTYSVAQQVMGEISFFVLFLHAFGVAFVFNLVDLLIIDLLVFCMITPRFIIIPGSEGAAGYKDYMFHFRGFLIGTVFSGIVGLIGAGLVSVMI
jgi:hypothetical protein